MTEKLITKSAAILDERGFTQVTSAHDRQKAGGGITHTDFVHPGVSERFFVRAKKQVYEGLAPFGRGMVEHALEKDVWLVCYFDDREEFYVFDPKYVGEFGESVENYSKYDTEDREWLEVSLGAGVTLESFVNGERVPDGAAGAYGVRSLEDFA